MHGKRLITKLFMEDNVNKLKCILSLIDNINQALFFIADSVTQPSSYLLGLLQRTYLIFSGEPGRMVSFIFCQVFVAAHIMPACFVLLHSYQISHPVKTTESSVVGAFI